jgi:hypothetical protein
MPYSYSIYKNEFAAHMKERYPKNMKILDVGAGSGTYGVLLRDYFETIDAVEIYPNYVEMFHLKTIYNNVFIEDINKMDYIGYNYIILGDVIEHMSIIQARILLSDITNQGIFCMVAVPYMFEQGEEYGNIHEAHLQPDLTHERFLQRYSMMKLLWKDNNYGYYTNY